MVLLPSKFHVLAIMMPPLPLKGFRVCLVEGGKYVYVRGLGDRYSKTALNRAEIPGLDPNRNTVQMDIFPSALIDNMVVYKTFSQKLPGSFSGGYVNIKTKDFPDRYTFQASASLGFNEQATFNSDFLTANQSSTDFLGFGVAERELPNSQLIGVDNIGEIFSPSSPVSVEQYNEAVRAFDKSVTTETKTPFLNQNYSLAVGNQKDILNKKVGYIFGASYQHNYTEYNDYYVGRYTLPGTAAQVDRLMELFDFYDSRSSNESVLWGFLFNTSVKLNDRNKVSLNLMRNQSADHTNSRFVGDFDDIHESIYDGTVIAWVQRELNSAQLKGEHVLGGNKNMIEWTSSVTYSTQDEPDLRYIIV